MEKNFTIAAVLFLIHLYSCQKNPYQPFNLDFEKISAGQSMPVGWIRWGDETYSVKTDSEIKLNGKYSIRIASGFETVKGRSAGMIMSIPVNFKLGEISLQGYIKTEDVKNGFAGLVLQTVQNNKILDYRDMPNDHPCRFWDRLHSIA